MFINNELKAIFLHNPKCGGVYVRNILEEYYNFTHIINNPQNLHEKYCEFIYPKAININEDIDPHTIRNFGKYRYFYSHQDIIDKSIFEDYLLFTFVRNPYQRIYSAYLYLKEKILTSSQSKIRNTYENIDYFVDFNTFIKSKDKVNNISFFHAFICQYEQLLNYENKININYIGKIETIDIDLINILKILNIKDLMHINKIYYNLKQNDSVFKKNIIDELNEESFLFINNFFEKDFEIFQYKKYNSFDEFKQYYNVEQDNFTKNNIFINLYKEVELIKYDILLQNDKYNQIIDILIKELMQHENKNRVKAKAKFNEIIKSQLMNINNRSNIGFNNINNLIFENLNKYNKKIVSNCNICNFKPFNILSSFSHNCFCN